MQQIEFKRDITSTITQRLREERRFIQVIIGPRQVGKTTAIHQALKEISIPHHYAAADLPAPPPFEWISRQWESARMKLKDKSEAILVLDEVQKIFDWSTEVKRLWDEDTRKGDNIKVVILGSSALLIQKGLNESLAGRFEVIRFSHWSYKECRDCFGWALDKFIYFGGYPGAAVLIDDEKRWAQYVRDSLIETAISKDVLLLNRVEKPALLRQLFVLAKADKIIAIEVKSGKKRTSLSGLAKFAERYKPFKTLVVGSSGIEVEKFLETDIEAWFQK